MQCAKLLLVAAALALLPTPLNASKTSSLLASTAFDEKLDADEAKLDAELGGEDEEEGKEDGKTSSPDEDSLDAEAANVEAELTAEKKPSAPAAPEQAPEPEQEKASESAPKVSSGMDSAAKKLLAAVQEHQNGKALKPAVTNDMESAITELVMGKSTFMSTPIGETVLNIKRVIEDDMMPAVIDAHKADQAELDKLNGEVQECNDNKAINFKGVNSEKKIYEENSPRHKECRADEAIKHTQLINCRQEEREKKAIQEMKCKFYAETSKRVGDTTANTNIVTRGGSEAVEVYTFRITATICGKVISDNVCTPGNGGGGKGGLLDDLLNAKEECQAATDNYDSQVGDCNKDQQVYEDKKAECDSDQEKMDGAACKRAVLTKDACETYAECYHSKFEAYGIAKKTIMEEEADRKTEWRGLKRMACLINCFVDGKVEEAEVNECRDAEHSTDHLELTYPEVPEFEICQIPKAYPDTADYKEAEYADLPVLAKGKTPEDCTGVQEINTVPKEGSPKSCKCKRVTMNGPYSGGPIVSCQDCLDVRRSKEKNSCPDGTKIFSPAGRVDWQSFIKSAEVLADPNFLVDVTSEGKGCGGCNNHAMNSVVEEQKMWKTQDGSPWWLREAAYADSAGEKAYQPNCYMNVMSPLESEDTISFKYDGCSFHSKSYYCQSIHYSTTPKKGSPESCTCTKVELDGKYSAHVLLKCSECLDVKKSSEPNSCPEGMKLFSPATKEDWKTFLSSAKPLHAPHWIVDVTRPSNGCGGCTQHAMKSENPNQATWVSADASPWWLRDSKFSQPSKESDYEANCYMNLITPKNENDVQFEAKGCEFHARSYYCQPAKVVHHEGEEKEGEENALEENGEEEQPEEEEVEA